MLIQDKEEDYWKERKAWKYYFGGIKMIDQILGYTALGCIVASYTSLALLNKMRLFYLLNGCGAILFFIQAIFIKQVSILLLHGFTGSILFYQLFRKSPRYICKREYCERRIE